MFSQRIHIEGHSDNDHPILSSIFFLFLCLNPITAATIVFLFFLKRNFRCSVNYIVSNLLSHFLKVIYTCVLDLNSNYP